MPSPEPRRFCIDCPSPDSKPPRPAPHGGPRSARCATHYRAFRKAAQSGSHDSYVVRTYNLQPGEYARLYEVQGGVCYICRRARGVAKKLAVDHDHKCCPSTPTCGRCTRGLLCGPCNKLLGHVRDDREVLDRASHYLAMPPAQWIMEPHLKIGERDV
jgi:hypothetical protein